MIRRKTIALVMAISIISVTTLFAGQASAKNNQPINRALINGTVTQGPQFSATSSGILGTSSSGLSVVTFQNYTPWKVTCYVDGNFVGVVYPGRTLSAYAGSGWTRPYAQALFVDRPPLSWDLGPVLYLPGGSYVFPMSA
ncbi:MAG: hypothetical protein JWM21_2497 [Acidobacteria bacterium]|nr:hypothetical protein [Acidobacteriota bacterium]